MKNFHTSCIACGFDGDHALVRDALSVYQWCPSCRLVTVPDVLAETFDASGVVVVQWAAMIPEVTASDVDHWFRMTCDAYNIEWSAGAQWNAPFGSTTNTWRHPISDIIQNQCHAVVCIEKSGVWGEAEHYRPLTPFEAAFCEALPEKDELTSDDISVALHTVTAQ